MKPPIYIFSGLGVDERVFQNLDFSAWDVTFIKWIPPRNKESIAVYSFRLSEQIKNEKPILIGLSFGGIVAQEVARHIPISKIILISSIKQRSELPWYYRFLGKTKIHRIFPTSLLKQTSYLTYWFFGAKSKSEKALLKQILKDTNSKFLKWAINEILTWNRNKLELNCFHIHGIKDHILPIRMIDCDVKIEDGGHFMIYNKTSEIQQILNNRF